MFWPLFRGSVWGPPSPVVQYSSCDVACPSIIDPSAMHVRVGVREISMVCPSGKSSTHYPWPMPNDTSNSPRYLRVIVAAISLVQH